MFVDFEERIVNFLAESVINHSSYSNEDALKIRFGLSILVVNISKALAIYIVAIALNILIPTLVAHITYCILRHFNYGFHFNNSFFCTLFGISSFPIAVFFIEAFKMTLSMSDLSLLSILFIIISGFLAPSYTNIIVEPNRKLARIKSLIATIVLIIICFVLLPSAYCIYIMWGIFISNLLVVMNTVK